MGYPVRAPLLWPAAFLSGATALVYEIVWSRHLAVVLGSTMGSIAAVLSSFMLGLALGAVLVGRRVDQSRRPLRWYGALELGIGVYALAFEPLLGLAQDLLPHSPVLLAFPLLLVPAALMGGTLPVMARAAADTRERGARAFGSLYGWNTLGAVAGSLAAVFFLLERFGLGGATWIAASVNIALGVIFFLWSIGVGFREIFPPEPAPGRRALLGDAEPAVVLAFFLAGFAGLTLEVAWTRLLVYFLEGFTIAFGLMLATYLLGLGLGALAGTPMAQASPNPRRLLVFVIVAEAILALATFLFIDRIGAGLEEMRRGYVRADRIDAAYARSLFFAAAAVILPATLCAGALMPIVARIAMSDKARIGVHSGAVYAASTLGSVLAPPLAGFVLLPVLGVGWTIAVCAFVLLFAAAMVGARQGLRALHPVFAGGALLVVLSLLSDVGKPVVLRSHVFQDRYRELVRFEEGRIAGVSVVDDLATGARALYLDDFRAAETGRGYGYMRMLGHLPVLLHPDPERVLVIAFGTGTTAGAVSVHPEVRQIDCVEIEPQVFAVADLFREANRDVLAREGTRTIVADGREFVGRGGEPYDVITLEPLRPYQPSAVHLYTVEFYEEAARRLDEDGILCQWIPVDAVTADDFRSLVASVAAAFDYVSLWYFDQSAVVLGSAEAPRVDLDALQKRCLRPELAADLREALVGDAAHLLGSHVVSGAALKDALGGAEPMRDDRTFLEFRPLPRRFGRRMYGLLSQNLGWLADIHARGIPWVRGAFPGLARALESHASVLDILARWERARYTERWPEGLSEDLDAILREDLTALLARQARDRWEYERTIRLAAGAPKEERALLYASAVKRVLQPDRHEAYLGLARLTEGEERRRFLVLALRENHLLGATKRTAVDVQIRLLEEIAAELEGPEKTYCLRRAAILRGEEPPKGEERLPDVDLPDPLALLRDGDADGARRAVEIAELAGMGDYARERLRAFWDGASDKREAFRVLQHTESRRLVLRAALHLYATRKPENLQAVAPYFCRRYPGYKQWEELARHRSPKVREAAARAADGAGGPAHLPVLYEMCATDSNEEVRTSAYIAFRRIEPEAVGSGYDPSAPAEEPLARLRRLAGKADSAGEDPRQPGADGGGR